MTTIPKRFDLDNDPVITATYSGLIQGFFWTLSSDCPSILFREPDELTMLAPHALSPDSFRITWDRQAFLTVLAELDDGPILVMRLLDEPDPTWIIYCTEYDDYPDDDPQLFSAVELLDKLYPTRP